MGDFHQSGHITTLHRLGSGNLQRLETELTEYASQLPIALVLPSLYSELQGPALKHILEELSRVPYLQEVVVALGRANRDQFCHAVEFFSVLPQKTRVIWIDGERIQTLLRLLVENEIDTGSEGKGRATWLAYGYVLAQGISKVIVQHDCDILTYSREFLARLCYPVGNPNLAFEFCKGYYARRTDRLHGRVTRLFVTPLLRTLRRLLGDHPFLVYLDSFRYPLAGECGMYVDLARVNRIPGDWGLEVGMLAEVYRNTSMKRICQVELCETYDHKHQDLSPEDPKRGLLKMAVDIAKSLFRNLAIEGIIMDDAFFRTLTTAYLREAQDTIRMYEGVAAINGLYFDRHNERIAVEAFTRGIRIAYQEYLEDPLGIPLISNWNRVTSAIPGFLPMLQKAVDEDMAMARK